MLVRTVEDEAFEDGTGEDADGVGDEIHPEEGVTEDEGDELDAAELVDPVGLIEFAELDGVGDEQGDDDEAAGATKPSMRKMASAQRASPA